MPNISENIRVFVRGALIRKSEGSRLRKELVKGGIGYKHTDFL